MTDKIVVKDLYKVFGDRPDQAMQMINDGIDKAEILTKPDKPSGFAAPASPSVRARFSL